MRASRILVVDDSEVIRAAVETALTDHGFEVTGRPDEQMQTQRIGQSHR